MLLSDSEKSFYGDPLLLPPSKRQAFTNTTTCTAVLQARIPPEGEPLPTLCAAYTEQHHLSTAHIANKGIFAALQMLPQGFAFLDPARFISLLGAVDAVRLPLKLSEAFRIVGNAIAIPHGLLALLIAFQAVLPTRIDFQQAIRQCWDSRLTADNAMIVTQRDWAYIIQHNQCTTLLRARKPTPHEGPLLLQIKLGNHETQAGCFHPDTSFAKCLRGLFDGPKDLLGLFMLTQQSNKYTQASSLQELALVSSHWQLQCGTSTVGTITFQSQQDTPPAKRCKTDTAVHISPTLPYEAHPLTEHPHIEVICTPFEPMLTELQQSGILDLFDHFHTQRGPSPNFTVLNPSVGTSFSCWAPVNHHDQLVHTIRTTTKQTIQIYRQIHLRGLHSIIMQWNQDDPSQATVILQLQGSDQIWACFAPSVVHKHQTFSIAQEIFQIAGHNKVLDLPTTLRLKHGDLLDIIQSTFQSRAGGHHLTGTPMILPADASFSDRAEFAANTHGWIAADEVHFICQLLHWAVANGPRFSAPAYWDPDESEFTDAPFGSPTIWTNATTHLPILVGNHWCALEIERTDDSVSVTTVQVPRHLHTRIILILARLLDVAPHRMRIQHDRTMHSPHLCGWQLIERWANQIGIRDTIAAADSHMPTTPELHEQISIVLQSSIEDWHDAGASPALWAMASRLRSHFFLSLARRHTQSGQVQQRPITTAFPLNFQPSPPPLPQQDFEEHTAQVADRIADRISQLELCPAWATSDEIDFSLEAPRALLPDTLICPPAAWDDTVDQLQYLNAPIPNFRAYRHILWVIADGHHWIQAECYKVNNHAHLFLTSPAQSVGRYLPLIQRIRTDIGYNGHHFVLHCIAQANIPDMCGYQIVDDIYARLNVRIPPLSVSQEFEFMHTDQTARLTAVWNRACHRYTQTGASAHLQTFAQILKRWLLLRVSRNQFPDQTLAGGAGPETMDTTSPKRTAQPSAPSKGSSSKGPEATDFLWNNDPWLKKSGKATQARWEDLLLQDPLPFHGTDGRPMCQTHRLQVTAARAGVVLTTKQHVSELVKLADTLDFALLIPTIDGVKPPNLFQNFEGPYEVTLEDSTSKTVYKRLTLMLAVKGKLSYKLPEPKLKLHTAAIAEIVLEIDSRLTPKTEFEKAKDHPLQTFRQLISDLLPDIESATTFYGVRSSRHPGATKSDTQLQCTLKAPFSSRAAILEASGQTILLTRDFMDFGTGPEDTTILPRFWDVTSQDLADMRITTKGIPGAAGIVVTRRGLALRIWAKNIALARKALMPSDARLTDENRHVIPKLAFQASGWPAGADPASVVKSVLEATGVATVPTRTFRAAGVYSWVLTAETMPKITRFSVDAGGSTHEILLQHTPSTPQVSKGHGKGKTKAKKAIQHLDRHPDGWGAPLIISQTKHKQDDDRISTLEARFDQLEQRQSSFEGRVESKFDTISDSLRQLLAASHPRAREGCGESPPSKFPKQG